MPRLLLLFLLLFFPGLSTVGAVGLNVAVSIKPIHSLVSALMQGVAEPELIITASGTPHHYNLRPSEVRSLYQADLVVWVGPELESVLSKPLASRSSQQSVMALLKELPARQKLATREGGNWGNAEGISEADHDHSDIDPHIWLSPDNARVISTAIASRLAIIDPANREQYNKNLESLLNRLSTLDVRAKNRLTPLQQKKYIVFHDAYQYFEKHFGLNPVGALAIDPDRRPGARRLNEIKKSIHNMAVECIFTEPQFEPRLVSILTEGTSVRTGILDPLGADLPPGPELYFDLISEMAASLATCLSGNDH